MTRLRVWHTLGLATMLAAIGTRPVHARPDDATVQEFRAAFPEMFATGGGGRRVQPMAVPDVFGPGAVLNAGNIYMKVTNIATIGNPFITSNDPSGQWPGASGIEYLSFIFLGIGGVNPTETDPASMRRVSFQAEWRPQTLDPEDRMYKTYDGQLNGQRLFDDDGDAASHDPLDAQQWIDEDFLDGRDN